MTTVYGECSMLECFIDSMLRRPLVQPGEGKWLTKLMQEDPDAWRAEAERRRMARLCLVRAVVGNMIQVLTLGMGRN